MSGFIFPSSIFKKKIQNLWALWLPLKRPSALCYKTFSVGNSEHTNIIFKIFRLHLRVWWLWQGWRWSDAAKSLSVLLIGHVTDLAHFAKQNKFNVRNLMLLTSLKSTNLRRVKSYPYQIISKLVILFHQCNTNFSLLIWCLCKYRNMLVILLNSYWLTIKAQRQLFIAIELPNKIDLVISSYLVWPRAWFKEVF